MQAKLFFPILIILSIIIISLVGAAGVTYASNYEYGNGVIPLEYAYAGDLLPGYKYMFHLHALGIAAPDVGAFADAGVDVNDFKYGIIGDDGLVPINVYIFISGKKEKIDSIWIGQKEYDAYVTLYAYCPGEQPSGAPSKLDESWFWVYVVVDASPGGTYTDWFPAKIQNGQNGIAPAIKTFYERAHVPFAGTKQSYVRMQGKPIQFKKCNSKIIGSPPQNGFDTRNDHSDSNNWKTLAKYLGITVIILFILFIIRSFIP